MGGRGRKRSEEEKLKNLPTHPTPPLPTPLHSRTHLPTPSPRILLLTGRPKKKTFFWLLPATNCMRRVFLSSSSSSSSHPSPRICAGGRKKGGEKGLAQTFLLSSLYLPLPLQSSEMFDQVPCLSSAFVSACQGEVTFQERLAKILLAGKRADFLNYEQKPPSASAHRAEPKRSHAGLFACWALQRAPLPPPSSGISTRREGESRTSL